MTHSMNTGAAVKRLSGSDLDRLTELTTKLDAMLAFTYGNAGPAFRNQHDDAIDGYMWACAGFAEEIKTLAHKVAMSGHQRVT